MQLFSVEPSIGPPESPFSVFTFWRVVVGTVVVIGLQTWFSVDAKFYLMKKVRKWRGRANPPESATVSAPWPELESRAQSVIDKILAKLPPLLLAEAETIPLLFDEEQKRSRDRCRTLGLYRGFKEGFVSERKGPIILYLRNIEQACIERGDYFEWEVRITYLHELGHHFGWDEKEVEERGL